MQLQMIERTFFSRNTGECPFLNLLLSWSLLKVVLRNTAKCHKITLEIQNICAIIELMRWIIIWRLLFEH